MALREWMVIKFQVIYLHGYFGLVMKGVMMKMITQYQETCDHKTGFGWHGQAIYQRGDSVDICGAGGTWSSKVAILRSIIRTASAQIKQPNDPHWPFTKKTLFYVQSELDLRTLICNLFYFMDFWFFVFLPTAHFRFNI